MSARVTAGIALVLAAAMALIVFEQRNASSQILSTLNQVNAALGAHTERSRDLAQQVAALTERVESLEKELVDLRRRVVTLPRRSAAMVSSAPVPLDHLALAPWAPVPASPKPQAPSPEFAIEVVPITWSTDWRSFQPAGIIAPPAPIVLQRKLSDPAFIKKLYIGYAALQAGDIVTTTIGLRGNAREANPFLRDIAHSPAALIGVKAATTVVTIVAIENLRERHPVVASVTLMAMNAALAAVTVNNVSVARRKNSVKP